MLSDRPEWLLFDLDNTLLDFSKSSRNSFLSMVQDIDSGLPKDELYLLYSRINHKLWEDREAGLIEAEELKLKRWDLFFNEIGHSMDPELANQSYFNGIRDHVEFVDFAQDLLEHLKGKFRMMIVTNGLSEVQHSRIEISDIGKYFEHIVVSDEIGSAKPQQAFFKHCEDLMLSPDKSTVMVIGDTLKSDVKGANDYGYRSVWFNHDYLERDRVNDPDHEINKLTELLPILGM